jgi:hypothetical protein
MQQGEQLRTQWLSLAAWLAVCPLALAIAFVVLPRFNSLYFTGYSSAFYLAFLALPFIGVFGILRHLQATRAERLFLSIAYLVFGTTLALGLIFYLPCVWAAACL